jgi:hypothetical protein
VGGRGRRRGAGAARDPGRPAATLVAELLEALGDLLTAGVGRPDATTRGRWTELAARLEGAGSTLLVRPVRGLGEELERALRDPRRGSAAAVAAALELAVMLAAAPGDPARTLS